MIIILLVFICERLFLIYKSDILACIAVQNCVFQISNMLIEWFYKFSLNLNDWWQSNCEQIWESYIIKYQNLILLFFVYNKADYFVFHIKQVWCFYAVVNYSWLCSLSWIFINHICIHASTDFQDSYFIYWYFYLNWCYQIHHCD